MRKVRKDCEENKKGKIFQDSVCVLNWLIDSSNTHLAKNTCILYLEKILINIVWNY